MNRTLFLLFMISALISSAANAYVNEWSSVRGLGMGNAYAAVVTDSDALFYNPASLNRLSSFTWTIFDPRIGANGVGALSAAQDFNSAKGDPTSLSNFLNGQYGKNYWGGFGAKTAITLPNLGFGFFGAADLSIAMSNPPYPTLDLNYFVDYGYILGGAIPLDPLGFSSFGLSLRRINRTGTSDPLHATIFSNADYTTIVQSVKNNGIGYGADAAFNFTIPSPVQPTFSVVYHDVGMTSFSHLGGPGSPQPIAPNLVAGLAVDISVPLLTVTPALEIDHINDRNFSLGKKLHAGIEVALPVFDFRAGLNEGYYTLGVGMDLGVIKIDAVTYGEELGAYAGQKEDRRYMAQMTLELGLPLPGFAHKSGSGEDSADSAVTNRNHLKQRR